MLATFDYVLLSMEALSEANYYDIDVVPLAVVRTNTPAYSDFSELCLVVSTEKYLEITFSDRHCSRKPFESAYVIAGSLDPEVSREDKTSDSVSDTPPITNETMADTSASRSAREALPSFLAQDIRVLLVTDAMANQDPDLNLSYHPKRLRIDGDSILKSVVTAYLLTKHELMMSDGITTQRIALEDRTALAKFYDLAGYEVLNLNLRADKQKEMIVEAHIGALRLMRSYSDAVDYCIHIVSRLTGDSDAKDMIMSYFDPSSFTLNKVD